MLQILKVLKESNAIVFVIVYLSFLLDNVLLTVVVPIIPNYLFMNDVKHFNDPLISKTGPESLSPLQRKYETLDEDNGPLGALLASKAFVQLVFTPVVGYFISIVGCYLPLLIGSCNMLLAAFLFAYGNSYGLLVLARGLHGSSSAAISVSGMSILAENVPKSVRTKVMPIAFGGISLGVLIGYPLGGAAYELLGKQAPFLLIALFISFSIGLQINFLTKNELETNEIVSTRACFDWFKLLKDTQTLIVACAICLSTSTMAILEPCVPMWLLNYLNPPPTGWQLGAIFIPDSLGYFIGSHFAGLLSIAPWVTTFSAMVLGALSCYSLPMVKSIQQLSFPHFGIGLSVGIVDAVLVPYLANLVDTKGCTQYGPVYALQQASVSMAYFFGPLMAGQAVDFIGFPWLMRIVAFLILGFCPLLIELEEPLGNEEEHKEILNKSRNVANSYSTLESSSSFETVD